MTHDEQQPVSQPAGSSQVGDDRVKLTVASGGWVLILMALACVGLVAWAVGPALMNAANRPPGDGETIESYGFDLSNFERDRNLLVPALLHRDMVPVMDTAVTMTGDEVEQLEGRDKYLVASDRVVGVTVDGESRAYPIMLLNVHEIIHDTLSGVPIAVTYNWQCDSVMVFDRRVNDDVLYFAISGMFYNNNAVYYDRRENNTGESLWVQLLGEAVSGPLKGAALQAIDYQLVSWADWYAAHPETTVVRKDPEYIKRYKKASPEGYFVSDEIAFREHISPMPTADTLDLKARVIAIQQGEDYTVFPLPWLIDNAGRDGRVEQPIGNGAAVFDLDFESETAFVRFTPADAADGFTHALWFAWHAMHPDSVLHDIEQ